MDAKTMAILKNWKKKQKSELEMLGLKNKQKQLVFHGAANKPIHPSKSTVWVKRIVKKNKLKPITTHGFRHTHCSLLFEADVSLKKVQDRMGHADIRTTVNIYAKLSNATKRAVVDQFKAYVDF